jgi:D-amino-acid oxidase
MNSMRERVAIVGAGVSGLTCGVLFAERGYRTSIFAAESGPRITSAAAGAIWFPTTPSRPTRHRMGPRNLRHPAELSDTPGSGVSMLELRSFARDGELEIPPWAFSLGARRLAPALIPTCFTSGYTLDVPLTDTTIYLDYLVARFRRAGGEIQVGAHFDHLDEVNRDCSFWSIARSGRQNTRARSGDRTASRPGSDRSENAAEPCCSLRWPPLMYAIPAHATIAFSEGQ